MCMMETLMEQIMDAFAFQNYDFVDNFVVSCGIHVLLMDIIVYVCFTRDVWFTYMMF